MTSRPRIQAYASDEYDEARANRHKKKENIMTDTHPSQRINRTPKTNPLNDLRNVVDALQDALTEAETATPTDRAIAELVWFAGRSQAEAIGVLAKRFNVDADDLRDAMQDPEEFPDLAKRIGDLVDGLVEVI